MKCHLSNKITQLTPKYLFVGIWLTLKVFHFEILVPIDHGKPLAILLVIWKMASTYFIILQDLRRKN